MKTLDDLSASKLHADEQEVVREAADALLFCEDMSADPGTERALTAFHELVDRLAESDRWAAETGQGLTASVEACGPLTPVS